MLIFSLSFKVYGMIPGRNPQTNIVYRIMSGQVITYKFMSCHIVPCHVTPYHSAHVCIYIYIYILLHCKGAGQTAGTGAFSRAAEQPSHGRAERARAGLRRLLGGIHLADTDDII